MEGSTEEGELTEGSASPLHLPTKGSPLRPSYSCVVKSNALSRKKWIGCSPLEDFEVLEKIGEGTFGEVFKATQKRSGKTVALKKIILRSEQEGFPLTALREIKLLKQLKHPNVIDLLDIAVGGGGGGEEIYMVFPYMDHDLTGLLEGEGIKFSIPQIKCYFKQLLQGLAHLHKSQIIHRDIKGANLLINNRGELKITDFGLARGLEENKKSYTPGVVTRWYRPPELLLGGTEYGPAIDLWGVGCILLEMHIRRPLFPGNSDIHQLELISKLCGSIDKESMPTLQKLENNSWISLPQSRRKIVDEFSKYDPLAADLADKLLVLEPSKRLSAEEALNHSYFKTHPLPALPQSLPTYPPSHEFDKMKQKKDGVEASVVVRPHPTPHEHGAPSPLCRKRSDESLSRRHYERDDRRSRSKSPDRYADRNRSRSRTTDEDRNYNRSRSSFRRDPTYDTYVPSRDRRR